MSQQLDILKEQMESLEKRYNAAKTEYIEIKTKELRVKLFKKSNINVFNLCDRIHYLICGYNHGDQCGYGYEKWEEDAILGQYSSKGRQLQETHEDIKKYGAEKVLAILEKLEALKKEFSWIRVCREDFQKELAK